MIRHDMPETAPNEAANLARLILDDSKDEHPTDPYTLNVHEARTLAHAVTKLAAKVERAKSLADRLEREAELEREKPSRDLHDYGWDDACTAAAYRIRAALNGDTA